MKTTNMSAILVLAVALVICQSKIGSAAPMGTAWTYQGRLMDANSAADGLYDFQFKLFDDPCTGAQQGSTIDVNDLDVIDGYFTAKLDFGVEVFHGDDVWLHVGVRPGDSNDPNAFVSLSPRQEVTPTPYAMQTRGIFVDKAENIGVGMMSPKGKLHVDGGKAADDTDASDITIKAQDGGDAVRGLFGRRGGDIILLPGEGGESPDLKPPGPSGKVGIGTAGPEAMLDVRGNIKVDQKIQAYDSGGLELATDEGTTRIFVADDGKVGIGTTAPRASLEVTNTGDSHAIWASTSDIPVYAQRIGTSGTWPAVGGDCNSLSSGASGVRGRILSTSPGSLSAGVYGYNYGTGSNGVGVRGYHDGNGAGVYGQCDNEDGRGVHGHSNSGKGVYGESSTGYGVYGYASDRYYGTAVFGINYGGNYGYLGSGGYGVRGYSLLITGVSGESSSGTGVDGYSYYGDGVRGESYSGYAGYFEGDVYVTDNVSALSFTDRTPYPKDLATAYDAIMSMERLPDGQYDENNKEGQLNHSILSDFIRSEDGNRDLSATVSCHNEVLKDLTRKQKELGKAHIYIEQLHKQNKSLEERLVKLEAIVALLNVSQEGKIK